MAHTYSFNLDVRYDECDVYGHLNNAVYLRYMQEAAFRASADAGLDGPAFEKMGRFNFAFQNQRTETWASKAARA